MMLIAYDPRRNPLVGQLTRQASRFRSSVVQLCRTVGALAAPAEDYTKKPNAMQGQTRKHAVRAALTAGGRFVSV